MVYNEKETYVLLQIDEFQRNISTLQDAKKLLDDEKGSWVAERTALKNEVHNVFSVFLSFTC